MKKITSLLIANRGEIACRIIRTAKRLGIKTIAIYADVDAKALHCQLADEAFLVGPVPSEKSYLNMQAILQIAKKCRVDAIHPGYGFVSENALFAEKCVENGFIFVGPSSFAIQQMAVKDQAKMIMTKAGVPTVPGIILQNSNLSSLMSNAEKIGYPIIIKASKGGGGKGMRLVLKPSDLEDAMLSAQRESAASFGDECVFIEKYITEARHIEVQIFRDKQGNAVHLFERDCSLQRRHQKIIEESPAVGISPLIKQQLYQAAINAANAIDYEGAGTVEFLYSSEKFYFMEMNTRLQVEHPVTEMITSLDLVEWQLRIASGEPLPLTQKEIFSQGHAIEARVYAEDPAHGFLPTTGIIKKMLLPSVPCRIDSGIQEGDKVSIYFDPLLAKVIVHGANRDEAILSLQQALANYHLLGITTNLPFLRNILSEAVFQEANIHTQILESGKINNLLSKPFSPEALAMACLIYLIKRQPLIRQSPWDNANAWRLNLPATEILTFQYQQEELHVFITHPKYAHPEYQIICAQKQLDLLISGNIQENKLHVQFLSHQAEVDFYAYQESIEVFLNGNEYSFKILQDDLQAGLSTDTERQLLAPMPGIITKIWVKPQENVAQGTKLLALEAMKMEHTLLAPRTGLIKSIHYQIGDQVEEGVELIDFESK